MKQYIHFFTLNISDQPFIEAMLEAFLQDVKPLHSNTHTYVFNAILKEDLNPLIQDMQSETLSDVFAYVSMPLKEKEMVSHLQSLLSIMNTYTGIRKGLLTTTALIQHTPISHILKSFIFQKYAQKPFMLETIKVYLECDQHAIKASQELYIHRNTLLMRLESFYEATGLDPRRFMDAYVLYRLL
jgi:hypothetical protein